MLALGLVETRGLIGAIEGADAMLKAADVRLLQKTLATGGLVTITIAGEVSSVQASVETAKASIGRIAGAELVSVHVIPRPDEQLRTLLQLDPDEPGTPEPPLSDGPKTPSGQDSGESPAQPEPERAPDTADAAPAEPDVVPDTADAAPAEPDSAAEAADIAPAEPDSAAEAADVAPAESDAVQDAAGDIADAAGAADNEPSGPPEAGTVPGFDTDGEAVADGPREEAGVEPPAGQAEGAETAQREAGTSPEPALTGYDEATLKSMSLGRLRTLARSMGLSVKGRSISSAGKKALITAILRASAKSEE